MTVFELLLMVSFFICMSCALRIISNMVFKLKAQVEKMEERLTSHEKSINNMVVMLSVEEEPHAETNS